MNCGKSASPQIADTKLWLPWPQEPLQLLCLRAHKARNHHWSLLARTKKLESEDCHLDSGSAPLGRPEVEGVARRRRKRFEWQSNDCRAKPKSHEARLHQRSTMMH